jgi:hypothetical protein
MGHRIVWREKVTQITEWICVPVRLLQSNTAGPEIVRQLGYGR